MEARSKAVYLREEVNKTKNPRRRSFDGGDGGGYDENMETRVLKLEECVTDFVTEARDRLARIETRLDQTWRLVTFVCGFGSALVAVTYFMATHIK